MADRDGNIIAKDYGIGIKPPAQHFHVKGHENAGWGMKARLSQIFAADGRTIMLAFDHGYIMGSTAGLERLDLVIPPLMDHADCLMATRGALRTCIPADNRKAIALRCSADSSVLKDDMSMGVIGTDIEEALRMNASCKDYGIGIKPPAQHFHVKGHENAGWGMKARLSQIFAADGRTIMLAFDHGYIMGSTAGLERLDLVIPPLMDHADCLMATRGALRTCIPADNRKAIALRCSADSSVLKDDMSMGVIGTDIEEALRMNASCMAVQCFIGSASEIASLHNLSYYINKGERYGIPVLGVVAVGKEMERTTRYFALATRLLAEQGAHIIKTYYCENFEQITAACPVPIVIAGGKKVPEPEALDMAYRAVNEGAAGVDMGRNVLQAECPSAMLQAIRMVVHENVKPEAAYKAYQTLMKDVK